MALPYPTKVVLPFDIATAQDMNERHANDVALAAGSGLDDEAVTAPKLAQSALDLLGSYSTSEVATPYKWINGKTIYKKTVDVGALPNTATKNVPHLISNLELVILFTGRAASPTSYAPLPWTHASPTYVSITGSSLDITTTANRSTYSGSVDIFYTKT